jgi:hypothetical protein
MCRACVEPHGVARCTGGNIYKVGETISYSDKYELDKYRDTIEMQLSHGHQPRRSP